MLLYSALLPIKSSVTKKDFVSLGVQWNLTSKFSYNIIPSLAGWNGQYHQRFGSDDLWMEFQEDASRNIVGIRYEKKESNGAVWDTDYVLNFAERKLAIRLDRSYTKDASMEDIRFSTPHFVSMLIDNGFVADDNGLEILHHGIPVLHTDARKLANIIDGNVRYQLPVIYVSKTENNEDPVNVGWLCSRLKGTAHILVQKDLRSNPAIRSACHGNNEYYGGIGIYFPNQRHRRFLYHSYTGQDEALLNKVCKCVLQYSNAQQMPLLYTWDGMNNALLMDELAVQQKQTQLARHAQQAAENEANDYLGAFDDEINRLKNRINELSRVNASLQAENQGLQAKLDGQDHLPVLFLGQEEEFFPGEIREIILNILEEALSSCKDGSRRKDVLQDVLAHNIYEHVCEKHQKEIKQLMTGYSTMSSALRSALMDLGIGILEDGRHYKLVYYRDHRYQTTMSKTGSDVREGRNIASKIINTMF